MVCPQKDILILNTCKGIVKMKRTIDSVVLAAILLMSVCAAQPKLKVAVIPKGTTHIFWKSVEAGARSAGKELGVEIL